MTYTFGGQERRIYGNRSNRKHLCNAIDTFPSLCWTARELGFNFQQRQNGFQIHPASYRIYIVVTFQGVKWQERESDNSLPHCDVFKIAPYVFRAWFLTDQTQGLFCFILCSTRSSLLPQQFYDKFS